LSVVRGDGLSLLRGAPPASAQLVLLDPPFEANLWAPALQAAVQALADPGYIYLEANRAWRDEDGLLDLGLQVHRQGKAGAVHFHLIGRRQPA
jgi:16S rRNA G966 N2-methylase RsmD